MGSSAIIYLTSHEREDVLAALRYWRDGMDCFNKYFNGYDFKALYDRIDSAGTEDFKTLEEMRNFHEEN